MTPNSSPKTVDPKNSSPEMRAKRLKRLRNLANLTREQMCEDGKINRNTLIGWENGRFGGLTIEGAKKVLAKISESNQKICCSLEWLMYGTDPEPSLNPTFDSPHNESHEINEDLLISYELAFFKSKNPDAVSLVVSDEGMLPQYQVGDYVAGKKKTGTAIQIAIGQNCIVQLEKGKTLLRNLREGSSKNAYTLISNNPTIKGMASVITDVKLIYAAPIIWHRKKDISFD